LLLLYNFFRNPSNLYSNHWWI